jgi:hypothetical protein
MRNRKSALFLSLSGLLLASACGCQALHSYRNVTVQTVDAETKKPIPGAEVRLSYPLADASMAPWQSVGTTGSNGTIQLRAAPYGEVGIQLDSTVPGYMSAQKGFPVAAVEAIKQAGFFESPDQRPVNFTVEMYAEPFPSVELVLPNGYRGTVKVGVKIKEDAPLKPGQRLFSYEVPKSGVIEIVGPPLLRRVFTPDFDARFADGTRLNRQPQGEEVGFQCLKTEGGIDYFLIGTRAEYEALQRADRTEGAAQSRSSGGKGGGGRGKRSRGGNQSAPESSEESLNP